MESYFPYGQHLIEEDDIKAVLDVLKSSYITQGSKPSEFENALASYCGAKYAVVFNSGTSALHAAYYSLGLSENDEFITSPITFVATSNAGLYLRAKPVFADIEPDTGNIDTAQLEGLITNKTKLIVPVHYSGHPVDLQSLAKIASKYNLKVVEDACHALGAKYKDSKIGECRYSDATVFSFHPVKHITTGEGGAVLTNNTEVYEKLLMFRSHGITKDNHKLLGRPHGPWYYEMQFLGHNYRMTDFQAALGISQLRKLDRFIKRRREIAVAYNASFKENPYFDIPVEKDYAFHAYHLYPIRLKEYFLKHKKRIFESLRENGVGVQVHYIPVYLQPYYKQSGYKTGQCLNAERFYNKVISLPIYPSLSNRDIEQIIDKVFRVFEKIK